MLILCRKAATLIITSVSPIHSRSLQPRTLIQTEQDVDV